MRGASIHVGSQAGLESFAVDLGVFRQQLLRDFSAAYPHAGTTVWGACPAHSRPSRSSTLARMIRLRMTATSATLCFLPLAISRSCREPPCPGSSGLQPVRP